MAVSPSLDRRAMLRSVPLAALLTAADAAPATIAATQPLRVPAAGATLTAGIYGVDQDLTVAADLLLLPGARIDVAAGRTLTLLGDVQAPAAHVFVGPGRVDLNGGRTLVARAEWWGAVANDPAVDCLAPLAAAIAAHGCVVLAPGDYHLSRTLKITTPNRRLEGSSGQRGGAPALSRLVLTRADGDVVQVGADRSPGAISGFVTGVTLRSLELARSVAPRGGGLVELGGPAGLRAQYAVACQFEELTAPEHATGYVLRGVVRSFLRNCSAYRSRPGKGDTFVGFLFDGSADFGLAGGNASLYVDACVASTGGDHGLARSIGAYLPGAFSDTYLTRFEMATMSDGIVVDGLAGGPDTQRLRTGNVNLHIIMPILDAVSHVGLTLSRLSPYAAVEIIDPYIVPVPGALASIHVHDGGGMATITGGQLLGWYDADHGGNAVGVHAVNAAGLTIRGLKLLGHRRPVGMTNCRDMDMDVIINNPAQAASQAAVQLAACDRIAVRARVTGGGKVFPQGVRLDGTANQHVAVDVTGIDPAAIAGGALNRLVWNNDPVRVAGAFGSNLASGIMV
ncbi:hypothetical protein K7957_11160 [Sphingomonas yunnanensis]|uniref:hypothetical protein n=1 Tax=Sphingomonas yunnanensis TaxID=310400 RepID=UPI001CA69CF9|nr:hypothetical protein [Sphingomonas yunnanensis]